MSRTIPHTQDRVTDSAAEHINQRLRRELEARILYYAQNPDGIDARLVELDQEWDTERVVETHAAGVGILGTLLAARSRKWLILPFAAAAFLLLYATDGSYPPLVIFRKLGVRTAKEINDERCALKVLRGDFNSVDISNKTSPEEKARMAIQTLKNRE